MNPGLSLEYDQILEAVLSTISKKPITIEEEVLVNAIRGRKLFKEDLDKIVNTLD